MKWSVVLAVVGFGFGIASAIYWGRSSRVSIAPPRYPSGVTVTGPLVTLGPLQEYLQRVSTLNFWAALYGGIGVFLSTLGTIVGSFGS
jgi:hypothetical protein